MSQNNINTVQNFYAAVTRGEFANLPLDPQIEWIEPHVPDLWFSGTHQGPDGVLTEVIEPTFREIRRIPC